MTVTASDHWITTEKGRLFARQWMPAKRSGEAEIPILLLHDSLGSVALWRDFPPQLAVAAGRPVVAYDRLGFGRSDAYPGPLPLTFIGDEAAVAARVCDALGIDRMVAFGHSVGGSMALATAARWPERCVSVVSESAPIFVEEYTLRGVRHGRSNFARPGQLERLARYHGTKARWVLDAWTETWLSPAFADWSLDAHLEEVRCPTLVLYGDNDEYGTRLQPERIARLTRGASQTIMFEGCRHFPHREQPALVLDAVTDFLASLDPVAR